jgi:hypothetical protein
MWIKNADRRNPLRTAENGLILPCFSWGLRTGRNDDDCYTSQAFASSRDDIHTTYYYYYKRT